MLKRSLIKMNDFFKYLLKGMASISLWPESPSNLPETSFEDDEKALRSDWEAVGKDIESVIDKTNK